MNEIQKHVLPFTQVPNELLNSNTLSCRTKAIYCFMLSKPQGWNFTIKSMATQLNEGARSVGSSVRQLKEEGWLSYTKFKGGKGVYTLCLSPSGKISTLLIPQGVDSAPCKNNTLQKEEPISNTILTSNTDLNNNTEKRKNSKKNFSQTPLLKEILKKEKKSPDGENENPINNEIEEKEKVAPKEKEPSLEPDVFNKGFLIDLISKTYRRCGQKITPDKLKSLVDDLAEEYRAFQGMSTQHMERCFTSGFKEEYGEYFGLNVKTFLSWIADFKKNENQRALKKHLDNTKSSSKEDEAKVSIGVLRCLEHFERYQTIRLGCMYIYDVLYDLDKLPKDADYKRSTYAQAKELIKSKLLSTKNLSVPDKKENNKKLEEIESPGNGIVVAEAKRIVLSDFFSEILKNKESLQAFKTEFSNEKEPINA